MTEQTKGLWLLIGGFFFLIIVLGFIAEGLVVLLGIWMIARGLRLRGLVPLRERVQKHVDAFGREL